MRVEFCDLPQDAINVLARLVRADLASHVDEPLELLGVVGLGLRFAGHASSYGNLARLPSLWAALDRL